MYIRTNVINKPIGVPIPEALRFDWKSPNWSGYVNAARKRNTFFSIYGEWTVPTISANPTDYTAAVSIWVGIDGFFNSLGSIIQVGITADYKTPDSTPGYFAWVEIGEPTSDNNKALDSSSYPVNPGDKMFGAILQLNGSLWILWLQNKSRKWDSIGLVNYDGPGKAAEFIVEAPFYKPLDAQAPLADYGQVIFDNCSINGDTVNFSRLQKGYMFINDPKESISTPEKTDSEKDGFTVVYGKEFIPFPPED